MRDHRGALVLALVSALSLQSSVSGGRDGAIRWAGLTSHRKSPRCGLDGNAHAESFFHSMKADMLHGVAFANDQVLRRCVAGYVKYYNHQRLHSALGYCSPVAYERQAA
jgi:transposase InsO family protein